MDQATPEKPSWRARISGQWRALKTEVAAWLAFTGPKGLIPLLSAALVGGLLGWTLYKLAPSPAPEPRTTPAVETAPGLQDQIDALRLRVIVLEARADALPKPAAAPRASAPRTSAARADAESPAAPTEYPLATTPAKTWGTTDLDREIAAFPSTTSLESSK